MELALLWANNVSSNLEILTAWDVFYKLSLFWSNNESSNLQILTAKNVFQQIINILLVFDHTSYLMILISVDVDKMDNWTLAAASSTFLWPDRNFPQAPIYSLSMKVIK